MIWMLCGKDLAPRWRYWEVGKFSGGPMIDHRACPKRKPWGPSLFFLFWGFLAMSQAACFCHVIPTVVIWQVRHKPRSSGYT